MLKRNEGTLDRVLRVILGVALLVGYFVYPDAAYRWAFLLGIIPLVTGLVGSCPIYSILGIRTCSLKNGCNWHAHLHADPVASARRAGPCHAGRQRNACPARCQPGPSPAGPDSGPSYRAPTCGLPHRNRPLRESVP